MSKDYAEQAERPGPFARFAELFHRDPVDEYEDDSMEIPRQPSGSRPERYAEGIPTKAGVETPRRFEERRLTQCHSGREENGFGPILASTGCAIGCS